MRKIVITGSEGVIGRTLVEAMREKKHVDIVSLALSLGHDLTDEAHVRKLFIDHGDAQYLVNLFAINDHVEGGRTKPDIFDVSLDVLRRYCETIWWHCSPFAVSLRGTAVGLPES